MTLKKKVQDINGMFLKKYVVYKYYYYFVINIFTKVEIHKNVLKLY